MTKPHCSKISRTAALLIGLAMAFSAVACGPSHRAADPNAAMIPDKIYGASKVSFEGSLWPGDTSKNLLFEDTKARGVGDIVTVVINESATSTQSANTNTSKDSSINMTTGGLLGLPSNLGIKNFLGMGTQFDPNLDATTERSNQGSGTTTRQGTFTATISAKIMRITSNGDFEIEGRRSVTINNEEQIMVLTGTIRQVDINFRNQISSTLIANASIYYSGEGVVADEQRVGWLTRFFSWAWPF